MRFPTQNDYESALRDWYNSLQEPLDTVTLVFTFIKKKPFDKIFMLSSVDGLVRYVSRVDFLSLYIFECPSAESRAGRKVFQNKLLYVVNRVSAGDVVNRCGQALLLPTDEDEKFKTLDWVYNR